MRARFLAYHQGDSTTIADLLDWAEYLPQLIAEPEDRTESYAAVLQDLAERFPFCSHIAVEFNQEAVSRAASAAQ